VAYVSRIQADGVLSFESLDLALGPGLTTVAGPNSIGKSNLALCVELVSTVVGHHAGVTSSARLEEFESWGFEGGSTFHVGLGLEFNERAERDLVADFVRAAIAYGGGQQAMEGTLAREMEPHLVEALMDLRLEPESLAPLYAGLLQVFFDPASASRWSAAWEFTHDGQPWHVVLFGVNQGHLRPGPASAGGAVTVARVPGITEMLLGGLAGSDVRSEERVEAGGGSPSDAPAADGESPLGSAQQPGYASSADEPSADGEGVLQGRPETSTQNPAADPPADDEPVPSQAERSPEDAPAGEPVDRLPRFDFTAVLPGADSAVGFHLSAAPGGSQPRLASLRRLAAALGVADLERRSIGFTLVLSEILRRTIVLTDNRRVEFIRDFAVADLHEPIDVRDGARTAALLYVLKGGNAAQRARFAAIQGLFTQLTGARVDVHSRPTTMGAIGMAGLTIEPVILSVHGDRAVARSGTGRQEALVLAVLLTGPPGRFLVLDEPAANLEAVGQRRLIGVLRGAGQCLLTTHSADLVPIHHEGDLYNLVRLGPSRNGAVAHRVGPLTLRQESKLVKTLAETDMRALLFADLVVLVEGETEAAVFQRWWAGLDIADLPPWETTNIHMVSVGGEGSFGVYVQCLAAFGVPWAIIADGPALARGSKLAKQFEALGLLPPELPVDDDFAAWSEMWRGIGVFSLAEQFGADGAKGGEIEAFLTGVDEELYAEAKRELGRSKPRLGAFFAANTEPPQEVVELYRLLTRHFGLSRGHPLAASAPRPGFDLDADAAILAVPRLPVTAETFAAQAIHALSEYPHLAQRLPGYVVERCAAATWPAPPAPLLFWLWTAADPEFHGAFAAQQCLDGLDRLIGLLLRKKPALPGSGLSRVKKLLPPKTGSTEDHRTAFRSTLFELLLAVQLTHPDAVVAFEPDGGTTGFDLTVSWHGVPLVGIEAYAPQEGVERWYEQRVARPWRVLTGQEHAESGRTDSVADLAMDSDALAKALADVLTDSNFAKRKAKQVTVGELPTVLAIRGFHLTDRIEDVALIRADPAHLAELIGEDAWSRLPERCQGLLVCFPADTLTGSLPSLYIPAPGRPSNEQLTDYLATINVVL
jgi:hypothetical protein